MPKRVSARIQDYFAPLTDPRPRKVTCPLINVVTIALCAVTRHAYGNSSRMASTVRSTST
jgi:hypothetical protein